MDEDDVFSNEHLASVDAVLSHSSTNQETKRQRAREQERLRQDIDSLLQEHPFAEEPSYITRPNRYLGPPSTWKSWTAEDRNVVSTLEAQHSADLSAHAWNAFACQSGPKQRTSILDGRSTPSLTTGRDPHLESDALKVPSSWTAWPLPPELVAEFGQFHPDQAAVSLEDNLVAEALRQAKTTWSARPVQSLRTRQEAKDDPEATKLSLAPKHPNQTSEIVEHDAANAVAHLGSAVVDDLTEDTQSSSDENETNQAHNFSSQAFAVDSSPAEPEVNPSEVSRADTQPAFMADDDRARQLLLPSARHTISKLEDLLLALHQTRNVYASKSTRRRSRSSTTQSETGLTDIDLTDPTENDGQGFRGRKRKRSPFQSARSSDHEPSIASRSQSTGHRGRPFGLRDWSDIIGMAALTGWSTETVARAAERCARLFSQNMMFRTFNLTSPGARKQNTPSFIETFAHVSSQDELGADTSAGEDSETVPTLLIRSSSPCARCRVKKLKCHPVQQQQPSNTLTACATCVERYGPKSSCTGIKTKVATSDPASRKAKTRTCPFPDCSRYTIPFRKSYYVQRHIKSVHPRQQPPETRSPPLLDLSSAKDSDLVCPVQDCPQHSYIYTRPARLYKHLTTSHPEIDIDAFKKLQAHKHSTTYRRRRDSEEEMSVSRSRSRSVVKTSLPTAEEESDTGSDADFEAETNAIDSSESAE